MSSSNFSVTSPSNQDQGWKLLVVEWTLLFVSTIAVLIRGFARTCVDDERFLKRIKLRRLRDNDYLMAASLLVQCGHAIAVTVAWKFGLGKHMVSLSDASKIQVIEGIQIIKGFSIVPSCLGRVSIALYQLRLLPPQSKFWKKATLMVVLILDPIVNLVTIIQIYSQCGSKVSALWNPAVAATAHCQNALIETNIGYGQSGMNSLCDLILSLFPLVILHDLQMPTRRKVQLYLVLSTSYLALIASIVKTVRIGELSASPDFTWNFVSLQIWVDIEINTIITTGSFPSLFPLLKVLYKKAKPASRPSKISAASGSSDHQQRSTDSQELSILKVQDYHVSVHEPREINTDPEIDPNQITYTAL